ncbi:hypothetical protein N7516_000290 [Penicillium verrucosum]|uniref:uncharacterized protein n=1 Tax=Penicillium verrucosum TaxID=60171 RepID=UPI0025457177|nr:uncharacterized protein N7516_000290 [Penicillium verrucosum]KAJ5940122.1 hypothetical protein N7516_000290 [Penicillium verrucosum]
MYDIYIEFQAAITPPIPPSIPNPVIDTRNPISADGVDLYHPDKWFSLYPINDDSLWTGDAGKFGSKLYFGGNSYSDGMCFQLSKLDRKTQIRSLTVRPMFPLNAPLYHTIGYSSEPHEGFVLVPKGLPSIVNALKGSYAEVERLEDIDDASPFQFVA